MEHPPGLLVDDPVHPAQHPRLPAAVFLHLRVERHATVAVVGVQRLDDRVDGLDPHQLSGA